MKNYIGIDLGTTNSAISCFNGVDVRIFKSEFQNDVTPSAIYFDKRGNKIVGSRAYDRAAANPDDAAIKFKKLIGTGTKFKIASTNKELTPEECSAEMLKTLFGYLPEEMRNDPEIGTVITVPAAFNQMQKDATMNAAEMAGIGKVALMQEPVAAVMSEMKTKKNDGTFLVFDLGGGTLDIAIATSIKNRVSLQAHGGIAMCGGTDFDRTIIDNIVKPWLVETFDLPDDLSANPKYKKLLRMALYASEKAKITLSSTEEAIISSMDDEINTTDESNVDIYIDIPIDRKKLNSLIERRVDETIHAARKTMGKAGLAADDIERIVFVGGPTQYKPLRDKVCFELGISTSIDMNPMTAVSEGAAIFAESIDWSTESRGRKTVRGKVTSGGKVNIQFNFMARTPDTSTKIGVKVEGKVDDGAEYQIDSLDTGWSSGKAKLKHGEIIKVDLTKPGDNTFKAFVFDSSGGIFKLENEKIVITRTTASMDSIPASSSIGVEILENKKSALVYLVKDGDALPKKGQEKFRAVEALSAGSENSINFILREGEIKNPVSDNQFIGDLKISGFDLEEGKIGKGDLLILDYEVLDSGQIKLNVTIDKLHYSIEKNLYSRHEGQIDFSDASKQIAEEAKNLTEKINQIASKVNDSSLDEARGKIEKAQQKSNRTGDPESSKQALDGLQEVKKMLSQIRENNIDATRQLELDNLINFFNDSLRNSDDIRDTEVTAFDNLCESTQRSINNNSNAFEIQIEEIRGQIFEMLYRQDWFVIEQFKNLIKTPYAFNDATKFNQLELQGTEALKSDDIDTLRKVLGALMSIRIVGLGAQDDLIGSANITRG